MPGPEVLNRVPRRSDSASWSVFDDEVVLLETHRRLMLGLNPSGGVIWELVDGQRNVRAIGEAVADHFGQPLEAVLDDTVAFLELLHGRSVIAYD
ncbi:MAG: PqqD family protein [Acidobacteriota bacterium]